LSKDVAEAVVSYRALHGRFADIEALLAVPGLDTPSLEKHAPALWFD
jgi:competence ComEA-like helix-hairpin-helix protein